MKKNIIIACIVLMSISQINAQRATYFGAKGGLNISTFGGGSSFDYFAKPGFHLGGLVEILPYRRSKVIYQPEVMISLQGSGGAFQDNLNFWYLHVPAILKYEAWDDLYIEVGPQFSLLFADNIEADSFGFTQNFDTTNSIDYGVALGAGYRLNEDLYVQIRFNYGLEDAIENIPSKNRNVQFSAVYFL